MVYRGHSSFQAVSKVRFAGATYDPAFDDARLEKQLGRVYDCMIDGRWRTLTEISHTTRDPEASISAQLRHLRKPRFGSYLVERRHRGDRAAGLYEYRLHKPEPEPHFSFEKSGQGVFA